MYIYSYLGSNMQEIDATIGLCIVEGDCEYLSLWWWLYLKQLSDTFPRFFDTYVQWLFNNNPGTQHARIHIHTHNSHVQGRQDIFNVCSKNCNLRFGILLLKISRIEVLGFSMSWNAHKWVPLSSQPMWNIGGWCGRFSVAVIWQMKSKLLQW